MNLIDISLSGMAYSDTTIKKDSIVREEIQPY
jgi:hypothetical protein